jgi:hypothetical protein
LRAGGHAPDCHAATLLRLAITHKAIAQALVRVMG